MFSDPALGVRSRLSSDSPALLMTRSMVISRSPRLRGPSQCQGHLSPPPRETQNPGSVQRALHGNGIEWPCIQICTGWGCRYLRNSKLAQDFCGLICVYCSMQRMGLYLQPLDFCDWQHQLGLGRMDMETVLLLCSSVGSVVIAVFLCLWSVFGFIHN